MSPFRLDIDSLPIDVSIYKKVCNDFVLAAFNKVAEKNEQLDLNKMLGCKITEFIPEVKDSGLFSAMLRVDLSGESEIVNTPFSGDEDTKLCRKNEVVKLPEGEIAVFNNNFCLDNKLEIRSVQLEQELNETEKLLEHQKKMFQHIMENSESISVQGYDEKHQVIYWNKASELLYGYCAEEALGKSIETLIIPKAMQQFVYESIESWLHDGVAVPSSELTLVNKKGADVHVFSQHIMIKVDAKHYEMYCVDIDLKEIKQLQKELLTQRNFLRTIFDVIPDLIWLQNLDGQYLACNTMFERFIGAKETDIIGRTCLDFAEMQSDSLFSNSDIKTKDFSTNNDYLIFADNSHKGLFETIKTPMRDDSGNLIGVLGVSRDITEHMEREQQLTTYAHFDTLTGLANRTLFMERLTQLTKRREKHSLNSAVLFIDLDHFKEINDTKGHSIGDLVLILVGQRLNSIIREGDTLARFGGDEFTILLEKINTPIEVGGVAQKILDILKEPLNIDHYQFHLTTSIGIAVYPDDADDSESLLRYADTAMYKAKEKGRGSYEFYTKAFSRQASDRVLLENNLRRAIHDNEFVLYYQPQIDVISKKVVGAEALIRWIDPFLGVIKPNKFITEAELSGQIIEIGQWVLFQAMRDMSCWREHGIEIETVSINLSIKQLSDKTLVTMIKETLQQTKCDPKWIEFEVTEGCVMNEPEQSIVLLEKIRDLGCKISIDDFGTGYSSLAYLKRLPVKKLKIDQSFVRDIPGDSDDEAIVKAVILIAQSMQLEVIAEGVEEEAQQLFLLEQGCKYSQGYLYAPPMPIKQFEKYLEQTNTIE